jgi:L-amino acid N-acyltransferase YncA
MNYEILSVQIEDADQILAIYAKSVETQTASWEYCAPTIEEMRHRISEISKSYPYLVAKSGDIILGYAYASLFRGREGWRFVCENSVYIAPEYQGLGIAKALMMQLIEKCTKQGLRNMMAIIGDSNNIASIKLHESLGFNYVATLKNIGEKFEKTLDCVILQRCLA